MKKFLILGVPAILFLIVMFPVDGSLPFYGTDLSLYVRNILPNNEGLTYCGLVNSGIQPDGINYYPGSVLFNFLDLEMSVYAYYAIHIAIGVISFYFFLGMFSKNNTNKIPISLLYGFSGVAISYIVYGNISLIGGFAFIPGILYFGFKAFDESGKIEIVATSIYSYLLFTSGGILFFLPLLVIFLFYNIGREDFRRRLKTAFCCSFLFIALSFFKIKIILENLHSVGVMETYRTTNFLQVLQAFVYRTGSGEPIVTMSILAFLFPAVIVIFSTALKKRNRLTLILGYSFLLSFGLFITQVFTGHDETKQFVFLLIFSLGFLFESMEKAPLFLKHYLTILLLLYLILFISSLYTIRSQTESRLRTTDFIEIKKIIGENWIIVESKPYDPRLDMLLVYNGIHVVNPYDSIRHYKKFSCGKYFLSNKRNLKESGLGFEIEPGFRETFKLTDEKKFSSLSLYKIAN